MALTSQDLLSSHSGRTLKKFYNGKSAHISIKKVIDDVLDLLNRPDVRRRMKESEIYHDRPALAGAIRELERIPSVDRYFRGKREDPLDPEATAKMRQAIGLALALVMREEKWKKQGIKIALGRRDQPPFAAGIYNRKGSLSRWFFKTERYEPNSPKHKDYKKFASMNPGNLDA